MMFMKKATEADGGRGGGMKGAQQGAPAKGRSGGYYGLSTHRIQNHPGDKALGMRMREFLD